MNLTRLVLRNLLYHRRGNLAVLLGVAVGSAVLTGALLVGDSLRGSLRDRATAQRNGFDFAITGRTFFHEGLAKQLAAEQVEPVLLLRGAVRTDSTDDPRAGPVRRAGQVTVLGIAPHEGRSGWEPVAPGPPLPGMMPGQTTLTGNGAYLSAQLARDLGARPGDRIVLAVPTASAVPRESLLGQPNPDEVDGELNLVVQQVLPDNHPYSQFSLTPSPAAPRNLFVGLPALQGKLHQQGKVNALLVRGGHADKVRSALARGLTLDDYGLVVLDPKSRAAMLADRLGRRRVRTLRRTVWKDYLALSVAEKMDANKDGVITSQEVELYYQRRGVLSVESRQLLMPPPLAAAVLAAAKDLGWQAAPTLVYLANRIREGNQTVPYSVVAALDPSLPPPLGMGNVIDPPLKNDEILLVQSALAAAPTAPMPGSAIGLTYFAPEQKSGAPQPPAKFHLREVIPEQGIAADPSLSPDFPGLTDATSITDWSPPPPFDRTDINRSLKQRDKNYWRDYRTAPKAIITLAAGQKLWGSRFGNLTSIRLAPAPGSDLSRVADDFRARLLAHLKPADAGLRVENLRSRDEQASAGSQDFRWLFVGFSIFLIGAALLLVGLLVRLNLERRASEVGLLLATGYRPSVVRRLLLAEGLLLAVIGSVLGLAGAIGYAAGMLKLLAKLWPTGEVGAFLSLHVTPMTLLFGFITSIVIAGLTIAWAMRLFRRAAPAALLAGQIAPDRPAAPMRKKRHVNSGLILGALIVGLGCLAGGFFTKDAEARAGSFFSGGMLLLISALAAVWRWLRRTRHAPVSGHGLAALARLGARNAARNPLRSLLTAALLASAAFLLVAVETFRREPGKDFAQKTGGSGGFPLLVTLAPPVFQDLNPTGQPDPQGTSGRDQLRYAVERHYQSQGKQKQASALALLEQIKFAQFRERAGDDVSCLNLYQPGRPQLLGAPQWLIDRGGFRFGETEAKSPTEQANPWLLLSVGRERFGGAVPVFCETNTAVWILKKNLGDELIVPDELGKPARLRIVGLFQDSVFQSELVMSEPEFMHLYPQTEGYPYLLAEAPLDRLAEAADVLRDGLARYGPEVTPTAARLQSYLAVENTYLTTFQLLGGFGLLLGALGLAVVLLRGVWERRGELALLRALGYRKRTLGRLVLAENVFLLLLGLVSGVVAALLAVAPSVLMGEGRVPWLRLAVLLGLVLVTGLLAGFAAVRATLRADLIPALRRE